MTRPSALTQQQRDQAAQILRKLRATRRKLKAIAAQHQADWASIDESLIEIDRKTHPEVGEGSVRIVEEPGRR